MLATGFNLSKKRGNGEFKPLQLAKGGRGACYIASRAKGGRARAVRSLERKKKKRNLGEFSARRLIHLSREEKREGKGREPFFLAKNRGRG